MPIFLFFNVRIYLIVVLRVSKAHIPSEIFGSYRYKREREVPTAVCQRTIIGIYFISTICRRYKLLLLQMLKVVELLHPLLLSRKIMKEWLVKLQRVSLSETAL